MSIGNRIKDLRKKKGLTQSEFAAKLEIHRSMVAKYEDDHWMSVPALMKLCDILDTTPDYILGYKPSLRQKSKPTTKDIVDYDLIKKWLSKSDIKDLRKEFGFVVGHVYNILGGRSNNMKFMWRAIARAVENKTRIQEGLKQLEKLYE